MKKQIKDRLTEVASFIVCLIIIYAVVINTGILKGFQPIDFDTAFAQIKGVFNGELKSDTNPTSVGSQRDIAKIRDYQPNRIPDSVLSGADYSGTWANMFRAQQKVVFYIYDNNSSDFNHRVQSYILDSGSSFTLKAYEQQEFNNIRVGLNGPTKMCNSLEECNRQRKNASDYTSTAAFLKMCGKTMCVINPSKRQFVSLKSKNSTDAVNMLRALENW